MSTRLFGTNGIRGVVNKELTPQFLLDIGMAIGTHFNGGSILVACDARTSSQMVKSAIVSSLLASGCSVHDAGTIPTPSLQYAVKIRGFNGGIMLTASHNPAPFNGIKVIGSDGVEVERKTEEGIEQLYAKRKFTLKPWNQVGEEYQFTEALELHKKGVLRHIDPKPIARAKLKVMIDSGNGVGSLITPYLLRDLGCQVYTMNSHLDGTFPGRQPEPTPEALTGLSKAVKAVGADLGIAHDGDADRCIFVDEMGEAYYGDKSFALIADWFLTHHPGEKIVATFNCSKAIPDIAARHGGSVIWTKVGAITVSRTILETGAKLGGEENGGVFYAPHQPVRDGTMTACLMLQILAERGEPLSTLIEELPKYYVHKGRVPCENTLKEKVLTRLLKQTKNLKIETLDGVKIWPAEDSWILLRPSGTEPVYRLYAESTQPKKAEQLVSEYRDKLNEIIRSQS